MFGPAVPVSRPVFIVGVGRSGSTVFHQLLARHPRTAWLSRLSERLPGQVWPHRALMRALDLGPLTSWATRYADPSEAYAWWDARFSGFSRPCRDLVAADLSASVAERLRTGLAQVVSPHRPRLLVKITGWSRIGFLKALYPDARFIHVLRDGRPVASSFLAMPWWQGWQGPAQWQWGDLTAEQRAEWERHDRSFLALAGIQWKILMDAFELARQQLSPTDFLEIRYEALCEAPIETFRSAAAFADLPWLPAFERSLRATPLRSGNERWRREFSSDQQAILEGVLRAHLVRYGYLTGAGPAAA